MPHDDDRWGESEGLCEWAIFHYRLKRPRPILLAGVADGGWTGRTPCRSKE
jgi:hypothetical protein